ncbi:NACHT domain-containing protein [Sphaerotilus uruguayifluvii]|uniref:NACHT domain-containing protein n=1 Tax=Sphaerotilus uruguayifluvii TaxID=2735897 RepID=A0ABX2G691_9BURK|nr:SUMF1/EgtB/PvdO family nonheme iron enzyme [Leptothrix sp. C29]NRT57550.1 hypothetical protein [Leptothrix sp. C29]
MVAQGAVEAGRDAVGRDQYNITLLLQPEMLAGLEVVPDASVLRCYLDGLIDALTPLPLDRIDTRASTDGEPLALDDVFEPLDTCLSIPEGLTLAQWFDPARQRSRSKAGRSGQALEEQKQRPVTALEALAHHRSLTLLGAAGGGKSTFGAWMLVMLARAWREELPTVLEGAWPHDALLPIRVTLRHFGASLASSDVGTAERLWAFIAETLKRDGHELPVKYLKSVAIQRGALFLFDGLDECGTPAQCEQVLKAIEALERSLTGTKSRFLRTVRPNAWKAPVASKGEYALAGLTEAQVDHFITRWYEAADRHGWSLRADPAVLVADLQQASRRQDLRELAANPLLLTLMAALHTVDRLPDDRADLYREAVTLLLMRWDDKDERGAGASLRRLLDLPHFRIESLLPALEEVAYKTHEAKDEAVHEDRLRQGFEALFADAGDALRRAQTVVNYIVERTGLLSWDGSAPPRRFEFPHRSFREYLAACHLTRQPDMASRCIALTRGAAEQWARWELVLILAARIAEPERGTMLAQALVESSAASSAAWTEADWLRARLAGLQFQEIGAKDVQAEPYRRAMADRVVAVLMRGAFPGKPTGNGVPARLRAQLGDVLGELDPRFDVENCFLPCGDDLGFVPIPGRDDLRFARYPVTVAQFRTFIEHSGFELGDSRGLRDPDHRPVHHVNHAEALAYCEWLTGTGCLPEGWRADLPDEHEWEHASRGGQPKGWDYWWAGKADPERANYDDTGIGDTSVVGCFPANGYGLYDMLGNIWEWTKTTTTVQSNGETFAVQLVRGGSWAFASDHMNCAVYSAARPDFCDYSQGFRVVLRHCTDSDRGFPPARE